MDELLTFLEVVEISGELKGVCIDPDDDAVLECAVQANATHIITGDANLWSGFKG